MKRASPLPLPEGFTDPEVYVKSLLEFGTQSDLLRTLCGGVHILDFFIKEPDLYSLVVPEEWRSWSKSVEISDFLDLLMRDGLSQYDKCSGDSGKHLNGNTAPPESLIQYIKNVRGLCLDRDLKIPGPKDESERLTRNVVVGMNPKKLHEVDYFTRWVNRLADSLVFDHGLDITHYVDFGSGQNFLGRALASAPYNKNVIAVESRPHVVEIAKRMDVLAKVSEQTKGHVDKKKFRAAVLAGEAMPNEKSSRGLNSPFYTTNNGYNVRTSDFVETTRATLAPPNDGKGNIQYVEHSIKNGDLESVIEQIVGESEVPDKATSHKPNAVHSLGLSAREPALMVMSIHSCGNLSHHGLRTLTMNPSVQVVAIIGCCHNLLTERLGPPTYKIQALRENNLRLNSASNSWDEHGFPMSKRFCDYQFPLVAPKGSPGADDINTKRPLVESQYTEESEARIETGIRFNITSRMMAVQAPQNWTKQQSEAFFTRHFYRALLQRIFLDKGIVSAPAATSKVEDNDLPANNEAGPAASGLHDCTDPVILGALPKASYRNFVSYVRAAVSKLDSPKSPSSPYISNLVAERLGRVTDDEIREYELKYQERRKDLSIVWSLMAFSAGIVESMIVIDRWCWLKEQEEVSDAWVEVVFDYALSPRNLVVVGIKKSQELKAN